jgi:hypothetical protein
MRVNLGGEGEVPGVINQQGRWILHPSWRSCRDGKTLGELQAEGHRFVISDNRRLPFPTGSIAEVITNSVPIDINTHLGPGVQSREIRRILGPGGRWADNRVVRLVVP